jgi:hypothetical protein
MKESDDTGREDDEVVVDSAMARTKVVLRSWWRFRGSPQRIKFVYFGYCRSSCASDTTRKGNTITEYYGQINCKATPSETNPAAVNHNDHSAKLGHAMSLCTCVHDAFGYSALKIGIHPQPSLTG